MSQRRPATGHILPLDGLRGLAILMVFTFHEVWGRLVNTSGLLRAVMAFAQWGYGGVDLFFVLSGFLITGILIGTRESAGFYKAFYIRRALRIFPLYYLAVACVFLVLPKVAMTHPSRGLYAAPVPFGDQIWFWLNISNVRTAFTPMLVPLLTNFWSLAIEEQFYLFWPAIIRRFSSATVVRICVIGFFLPLVVRCLPHPAFGTFNFYYRLTPFHMEGLLAGAGLAFVQAKHQLFRFRSWYIASLVASAVGILAAGQWPDARILHEAIPTFFSAGSAGLIGLCLLGNQNSLGLARVFSSKPLRLFGDCSYFIYIFHTWFGLWVTVMLAPLYSRSEFFRGKHRQVLIEALVTLVCVLGAAVLSRVFFEGPFLRLKRYFPYGVAPAGRGGRAGRANPTESVPTEA